MDRREFLASSATAIAATASLSPGLHPLSPLGLQLYTVRDAMQRDFEGTLARVARVGYREVEFAGYFDHSPVQVHDMLRPAPADGAERAQ